MAAFDVALSCAAVCLCELPHLYTLPFIKGPRYKGGEIKASVAERKQLGCRKPQMVDVCGFTDTCFLECVTVI